MSQRTWCEHPLDCLEFVGTANGKWQYYCYNCDQSIYTDKKLKLTP